MNNYNKYLKYKTKYINLKKQQVGGNVDLSQDAINTILNNSNISCSIKAFIIDNIPDSIKKTINISDILTRCDNEIKAKYEAFMKTKYNLIFYYLYKYYYFLYDNDILKNINKLNIAKVPDIKRTDKFFDRSTGEELKSKHPAQYTQLGEALSNKYNENVFIPLLQYITSSLSISYYPFINYNNLEYLLELINEIMSTYNKDDPKSPNYELGSELKSTICKFDHPKTLKSITPPLDQNGGMGPFFLTSSAIDSSAKTDACRNTGVYTTDVYLTLYLKEALANSKILYTKYINKSKLDEQYEKISDNFTVALFNISLPYLFKTYVLEKNMNDPARMLYFISNFNIINDSFLNNQKFKKIMIEFELNRRKTLEDFIQEYIFDIIYYIKMITKEANAKVLDSLKQFIQIELEITGEFDMMTYLNNIAKNKLQKLLSGQNK